MKFDLEKLEFIECEIDKDKLAISGSDRDLTWGEFKIEVEAMKEKILSYNLPQGHPIVIYGHKETDFIVSIVASMSLKMPYIPVDTIYPLERLNKIIDTTQSVLLIDTIQNELQYNKRNSKTTYLRDEQIIYIIFTSGSTGEPKGVQITKSAILDFKQWLLGDFELSNKKIFMNQAPFSFDLSVYELMGFLLFGSTIILNSREMVDNHLNFFERLKKYKCNVWVSTPSFISKYLMSGEFNQDSIPELKDFLFCGEILPSITARRIRKNFTNARVLNSYGPTEATVATTLIEISDEIAEKYKKNLPVGFVKPRTKIDLLNKDNEGIGEIQIIGDNVSIGYFKNEQLNKEKFLLIDGKRAFNTGDYGYFENGMLFFAERKDELIKLHGFRIELTEIDNELINIENIKDAITVPLKRGNEVVKLVSFIISDDEINIDEIKEKIAKILPYYMVPSDMIQIGKFPYNANHKIDKKALIEIYKGL